MADRRKSNDLSIGDYVQAARFHPWAVVVPMVVIGIVTWLALGRGGAEYEASARVVIAASEAQQGFEQGNNSNDPKFLANEVRFAKGDAVLSAVSATLGADAPDELDGLDVEVTADTEADLLTFSARADSSQGAADLANSYATIYVEQRRANAVEGYNSTIATITADLEKLRADRAQARVDLDAVIVQIAGLPEDSSQRPPLEARRATLEANLGPQLAFLDSQEAAQIENLSRLKISQSLAGSGIAQVTTSAVPDPDPLPNAGTRALIVGEIIGLIIGLLAAVTLENRNDRLREPGEVERAFGNMPILGSIPYDPTVRKRREVTVLAAPHSSFSEAIYQVRTSLRFLTMEQGVRLVVVTSANPSEGKTTFTSNFAWALAGLDEPVVLIDGDLRKPVAHQHFGVELAPGLTDMVIDKRPLQSVAVRFEEQDGNFSMVPAGTHHGNPADFMGSMQLLDRLRDISQDVMTVVDAAPVLPVSDSRALAGASDLTILMVRLGSTRRSELSAAIQSLRNSGARSIALVLVGVKPDSSSYYGYGKGDERRQEGVAHPTAVWRLPVNTGPRTTGPKSLGGTEQRPEPRSPEPSRASEPRTADLSRAEPRIAEPSRIADPRRDPMPGPRDSGPQLPPKVGSEGPNGSQRRETRPDTAPYDAAKPNGSGSQHQTPAPPTLPSSDRSSAGSSSSGSSSSGSGSSSGGPSSKTPPPKTPPPKTPPPKTLPKAPSAPPRRTGDSNRT